MHPLAPLPPLLAEAFGDPKDPILLVTARAEARFGFGVPIVWEGDAQTFQFSYVNGAATRILGYPADRWTTETTFWADIVVHPDDRDDAIAYCALATGKGRDHRFEYRARAADGRLVWLRDFVQVVVGPRGVPQRLRGIMLDITEEKRQSGEVELRPSENDRVPSPEALRVG